VVVMSGSALVDYHRFREKAEAEAFAEKVGR
jgi:hypothetical protein